MSQNEIKLTAGLKTQNNEQMNMLVKGYFFKNPKQLAALLSVGAKVNDLINKPENLAALKIVGERINSFVSNPEYIAMVKNITIKMLEINKTLSDPNVQRAFKLFLELPAKRRVAILNMSESGWFPFEESIRFVPLKNETIDEYMVGIIENNYDELKKKLLEKYNERQEILQVAFQLVEDKNHIAAIPLLLTQIDGISQDNHGEYYFAGKNFPRLLKEKALSNWDENTYGLLSAVIDKAHKTFISNRFDELKGSINKINILNRNGILHGDREFLNYGEEVNTYKVFSLLLYVDWMSELLNEEK